MRRTAVLFSVWLASAPLSIVADEHPEALGGSGGVPSHAATVASVDNDASATQQKAAAKPKAASATAGKKAAASLDREMESIERSLVELKKDLVVLEEDLLYPASSQVAVFLSMDVGEFFALDTVSIKLNGKEVTHYLYTERQADALFRGGVQRLYVGNARQGKNEITAFFTGKGPAGRDYRRATTVTFEKTFEPTFVELKIADSTAKYQPEFVASISP